MDKIKRILIATDLSPLATVALQKGLAIAKTYNAEIVILHILEKGGFFDRLPNSVLPPLRKELIKSREYAKECLEKEINKLKRGKIKIKIAILSSNNITKTILSYVKKNPPNLMLMGAHGRYTFYDWFVGTTAEWVIKKITCPVLIIKKTTKTSFQNILLPVDFSTASKNAVEYVSHLFPKSKLHSLYVADQAYNDLIKSEHIHDNVKGIKLKKEITQFLMTKIKSFISSVLKNKKNISFKILFGYPSVAILKEANKKNYNLVVMGTQGHNQRYYSWLGRVSSGVLIGIKKDILLVPPKNTQSMEQNSLS